MQLRRRVSPHDGSLPQLRVVGSITLGFEDRRRSRMRALLDDGREATVVLPRGTVLRQGDRLVDDAASVCVMVRAAPETVSVVASEDVEGLTRLAYHLGNRHVALQVGRGWLAYSHDHVLDGLVHALGLAVRVESRPFEPETGGYGHGHGQADPAHEDKDPQTHEH